MTSTDRTLRRNRLDRVHRVVTLATLNVPACAHLDDIEQQARRAADVADLDLLVLPESCTGLGAGTSEPLTGPTLTALSAVARQAGSYLLAGFDRRDEVGRYVSAVLLDRAGEIVGVYDKQYPYWPELSLEPPVRLGGQLAVWQTDFAAVGAAICFDVNFPTAWQDLADAGADIVVWPSAYAGGSILGAYATIHHYHVLSCTQAGDSRVYDPTGGLLESRPGTADRSRVFRVDLDRGVYHENFNMDRLAALLAEHGNEVEIEKHLHAEQWVVLRARHPGVSARMLAHQYGLEELRDYVTRSRVVLDELRAEQGDGP